MFFGVNFLFGSVFVWLAMFTLGASWALAAAFIGAFHTVELWGHGYAHFLFTMEAAFVCFLGRNGSTSRASILVLIYWMAFGAPMALLLYTQALDLPWSTALLVASKQALNGFLNMMIAALFFTLVLFFHPELRIPKRWKDANSYSGLLQAIFGLAFLLPILLSEFYELKRNFQRFVSHELAQAEINSRRSSQNTATFLKLETVFWGTSLSEINVAEDYKKIEQLVEADISAAPSQIYTVMNDGSLRLVYGQATSLQKLTLPLQVLRAPQEKQMSFLLGCHEGQFMSLFAPGRGTDLLAFIWQAETTKSISYSQHAAESEIKCVSGSFEELNENSSDSSVVVLRDTDPSTPALQSWLGASVQAQTRFASLFPALLQVSHSLKTNILRTQQDTNSAVQRLCVLAMLIILGGQILDVLFRKSVGKFARISEAYLKHRKLAINSLNPNFREDRAISAWLDRFVEAVEQEEQSKQQAQQKFSLLLAQVLTPVFATNSAGKIKVWNPALQGLTGYSEDEVLGKAISDFIKQSPDSFVANDAQQAAELLFDLTTKSGKTVPLVISKLGIEKGETGHVLTSTEKVDPAGSTSYFIAQNVGSLKEAQAKLLHASRLAALGEMASSFAHELNQPLNVIALAAGGVAERGKYGEVPKEYLIAKAERIEAQALRAGRVIQGIRNFVLEIGDDDIVEFDPVVRTKSAIDLIREQLRLENVTVHINTPSSEIKIKGRPILFEQAMVNLLVNAKQAMERQALSERKVSITFSVHDTVLTILVKDTGPGIAQENFERIFEPFFSSKKDNGGSGIGLYMTKSVIKELDGTIRAVKEIHGACFEIKFPTAPAASES
ncbi:PAS domain-containing sensor histidine kinase [Shimia sagamensis]|nr:ATP-binding protein [Shimia sagamensis]